MYLFGMCAYMWNNYCTLQEDADSRSAVRDALIDMAPCYKSISETDITILENLLLQYVEHVRLHSICSKIIYWLLYNKID